MDESESPKEAGGDIDTRGTHQCTKVSISETENDNSVEGKEKAISDAKDDGEKDTDDRETVEEEEMKPSSSKETFTGKEGDMDTSGDVVDAGADNADGENDNGVDNNEKVAKQGSAEVGEEYEYTKRDPDTTELYKIFIKNIHPKFGFKEIKKKLISLELDPVKLKKWRNTCYVTFRNEEEREKAITKLDDLLWRGNFLKVWKAKPAPDPLVKKRQEGVEGEGDTYRKKMRSEEELLDPVVRLKNAVTPLWTKTYDYQLKKKEEDIKTAFKRFRREFEKNCPDLDDWLREQGKKYNGFPCEVQEIIPSPVTEGYRNKCEFTIGPGLEGKGQSWQLFEVSQILELLRYSPGELLQSSREEERSRWSVDPVTVKWYTSGGGNLATFILAFLLNESVVGFRFGLYSKGSVQVGPPDEVSFVSETMKTVVKAFQSYLDASSYKAFNPENHTGYWKQLALRTSRLGHVMAMVDFHPQQLSQEEIEEEVASLQKFFQTGDGAHCGVTTLSFRTNTERMTGGASEAPYRLLFGEEHITESLLGMKFRISPNAFFQVNTEAAEVLYKKVAEWSNVTSDTTVLDICCGTGTIGLSLAKSAAKISGVDLSKEAIEDAKVNASLNDISNVEYRSGKAEDWISWICRIVRTDDVVAILDPPRGGLGSSVIQAIRKCRSVKRLVYVSCNPAGAVQNFVDLVRPPSKRLKGPRFFPVKAVPIDLFPYTNHCELVVLFEQEKDPSGT